MIYRVERTAAEVKGRTMQKISGFTIIELIITLAIFAIISAFAAPSLFTMIREYNLNKSSRDLISVMQEARAQAVMERRNITVALQTAATTNLPADTATTYNWRPSGQSRLTANSAQNITFSLTGAVLGDVANNTMAAGDTSFRICRSVNETTAKIVTISRMGTVQMLTEGTCT